MTKTILISGAGVAGPALAFWLGHNGFQPTAVERAAALREGGQAVDFRGPAHFGALRRMGLLDEIHANRTHPKPWVFVDEAGKEKSRMPADFAGGDVEIRRGDLSRILYEAGRDGTEYLFGDRITSLTETADGVHVTFEHARPRRFDLVVGADGMHSAVRALAFGDEARFVKYLGAYLAGFSVPGEDGATFPVLSTPGRFASPGLFIFRSPSLHLDRRDVAAQKEIVARAFDGLGWRVPELVDAMRAAPDLYFDSISQVRMDRVVKGRVALLGDAAFGTTLGGMGTGLAIVSAYVLAGELAEAGGDHTVAFERYEQQIAPYAKGSRGNAAMFLAPPNRFGIWMRNTMLKLMVTGPIAAMIGRFDHKVAAGITLKDYPSLQVA